MAAFDYKFNLPISGWEDQTTYVFKGPTVDDLDHYLMMVIDRNLESPSLETYMKDRTELITNSLQGIDIIKDTQTKLPNDLPMGDILIKWTIAPRVIRYKRYMFVVQNGMGFTLNCDYTTDSYRAIDAQITQIVGALFQDQTGPQAPKPQGTDPLGRQKL